jgi:hypothetical protein
MQARHAAPTVSQASKANKRQPLHLQQGLASVHIAAAAAACLPASPPSLLHSSTPTKQLLVAVVRLADALRHQQHVALARVQGTKALLRVVV